LAGGKRGEGIFASERRSKKILGTDGGPGAIKDRARGRES